MTHLHYGTHPQLEDAATEMIRQSLEGVTSMSEKSDILTPWKEMDRRRREVYTSEGAPDAALRRGMYHRVANFHQPHLNSVEGKSPMAPGRHVGALVLKFIRDPEGLDVGAVFDLRVAWGNQQRIKCLSCSRYCKPGLNVHCRCGSVYSQMPDPGHYQIVRLA